MEISFLTREEFLLGYHVEDNVVVKLRTKVGSGTGVPPVSVMARMAMPQGSGHTEL